MQGKGCKVGQCFNDILGIRILLDEYPTSFPEYFRVVDMKDGKKIDDGYRAIHLYYQKDAHHYPIEVQLWCGKDINFNIWSHTSAYKYVPQEVGLKLRTLYDIGKIKTQIEFENKLKGLLKGGISDMTLERYLDTNIPNLYVIAKGFNDKGSIYYRLKNRLEIRSVPDILELLRPEGMQIVLLDNKEIYGEYAPYKEVKELSDFINLVGNTKLN